MLQGQSMLNKSVKEYKRGSAERKHCMANLARLCTVENLPLHIGTRPGFDEVHEVIGSPEWSSISKQSMTRSVERQSERIAEKKSRGRWKNVAKEHTDIAFTTQLLDEPNR